MNSLGSLSGIAEFRPPGPAPAGPGSLEGRALRGRVRASALFCWLAMALSSPAGLLPPMTNGSPDEFAPRRAGAEVDAVHRVGITNDGLYRIDQATLAAAGFTNPVGDQIRMFCRTQEVALYVSTAGAMTPSDYLVFYGQGHDGYYTRTNVYWLGQGGGGLRMPVADAAPLAGGTEVTSCAYRVEYGRDVYFIRDARPLDDTIDHWFAAVFNLTINTSVMVSTTSRIPDGTARFDGVFVGRTDAPANPDHRTRVRINGYTVTTDFVYEADAHYVGSCVFSNSLLSNGLTAVEFQQIETGVTDDRAVLEEFSLTFTRSLAAAGSLLSFSGRAGTNNYTVTGLASNQPCWALDITVPSAPVLLTNYTISPSTGGVALRFGAATAASNQYWVCSTSAVRTVAGMEKVLFRDLADTNRQADFIAICPYEFRRGTYELLEHRYLTGLRVAVAPITDIYNEFSYGIKDADAIKQFIGYAFHHWRAPEPAYVMLVGDGSYDPMNHKGVSTNYDWVPVHLGPTSFDWAAQDTWFATVHGPDSLADIALGRLPVSSVGELTGVVAKVVAYDGLAATNSWRKKALLVSDETDGVNDFWGANETNVLPYLPAGGITNITKAYAYTGGISSPAQMRSVINNAINQKTFLVSYFGHGAADLWSFDNFYNNTDLNGLANSVWPVFIMLTCRNGLFDDPARLCMSETALRRPAYGSIASAAASALSIQQAAEYFAAGFAGALVNTQQNRRAGGVMNAGFSNLWTVLPNQQELLFYNLIGDPAQIVNP